MEEKTVRNIISAKASEAVRESLPSGIAVAAFLAAMIGLLAMALTHLGSEASQGFQSFVHGVGKAWMPGAEGIGPYSGKETVGLVFWLGSWVLLHLSLRRRDMDLRVWLIVFLIGMGVATTLFWTPVIRWLLGE